MPCFILLFFFVLFCFGKWKGSGGLKASPGTTEEQSKFDLELCNTIILQDPEIKNLYGIYKVEGAGQVTLDKTKVRKHISNIMFSLRKPSAYHKLVRFCSAVQILRLRGSGITCLRVLLFGLANIQDTGVAGV